MPNATLGNVWGRQAGRVTLAPHAWVNGTNLVGIEIELEGTRGAYDFNSDYWDVKEDGSLRGGHEFVMRNPTGGVDLRNAVVELDSFLHNRNPDGNWRCSTHVHVDVRDMTGRELKNLILIYLVLEKFLFKLSGIHRYKNNFCCALGFAQQQMKVLTTNWTKEGSYDFSNGVVQGWDKYSALNLLPITSFGSVEFRLSEAKWRKGQLMLLTNRFLAIKELAKSWQGTHEGLIEHVINSDVRDILPKGVPKEVYPEFRDDLMVGYKLAYDLVTFANNVVAIPLRDRNDALEANELWSHAFRERGERETVPAMLYLGNSPALSIEQGIYEQVVQALRVHHNIYITNAMNEQMNMATIRWILEKGQWGDSILIRDRDDRNEFRQWSANNPVGHGEEAGEAPQARIRGHERAINGNAWMDARFANMGGRPRPAPVQGDFEEPF